MAHWARILGDDTVITRTILLGDEVAGNILCFEQSGMRLVGYWIGKEFWGKGIATRALSEFLGQVAARPLHAHVSRHNAGSIRVLEKCGFALLENDNEDPEELLYVLDKGDP
jgi:RimJ/RimL family protein N-acetyltransferase